MWMMNKNALLALLVFIFPATSYSESYSPKDICKYDYICQDLVSLQKVITQTRNRIKILQEHEKELSREYWELYCQKKKLREKIFGKRGSK